MPNDALFIAATGQHVGKTTVCLGLLEGLCQRLGAAAVGFTKPVGQQHVEIESGLHVDKDSALFKDHFQLTCEYEDMSPVMVPAGFTRRFIDGEVTVEELRIKIKSAFERVCSSHSYTIVEGTGHVGVGSIIDLNNAQVASLLGLEMVIIASGGLGSAFDELAQNVALCKLHGVHVRGVILNRVIEDKQAMIMDYFSRALARWDIPLVGCIPYNEYLSTPCMRDFELLFDTPLLSGESARYRHFSEIRLVATTYEVYRELIAQHQLVITPAKREDIIMATLTAHRQAKLRDGKDLRGGMILTGRHPPSPAILKEIREAKIPILYANMPS
ncbi:MAG: AAA family ATPase, partial [Chlamydiia bacterium]|nr:AAA family ATPase [Chlamydiia bacterium]